MKFLFYVEREFHLELLKNIITYIAENKLGMIALWSPNFQESSLKQANRGCNFEYAKSCLKNIDFVWFDTKPISYQSDICFIADSSYEAVENLGFIVNIGHGTICKGSFYTDSDLSKRENCADLLCVPSQLHYDTIKKHIWTNMIISGMPKFDSLYTYPSKKEEILEKLGLDVKKQTILFAPTFNQEFSIIPYIQDQLRKYIPEEFNIIIKLHGVSPKEWSNNYKILCQKSNNMVMIEDYSITESLIVTDIIISDVSSIAYEFLSFHKKVLVFNSPLLKTHPKYNPDDLEYKYRNELIEFNSLQELNKILRKPIINETKPAVSFLKTDIDSSETIVKSSLALLSTHTDLYYSLEEDLEDAFIRSAKIASIKKIPLLLKKPNYKHTIFTDRLIYSQLFLNKTAELVSPLFMTNEIQELTIENYFPETKDLTIDQINAPLSYRNSYKSKRITNFSIEYFICKHELLEQFLQSDEVKSLEGFKNWVISNQRRIFITFDALVY